MPKKRGRPKTGRGVEGLSAFIRFTKTEYDTIERAIAVQARTSRRRDVGSRKLVTVPSFSRDAALLFAEQILESVGEKVSQ